MNKSRLKFRIGIGVILISIAVFFMLFAIPFLQMELKTKLTLTPILLVAGEVLFWLGIVLIGKDVYLALKTKIMSGEWLGKKTTQTKEHEDN